MNFIAANRHAIKTIVLTIKIAFKNVDVEVSTHIDRGLRDASEYHGVYRLKTLVGGKLNVKDVWIDNKLYFHCLLQTHPKYLTL